MERNAALAVKRLEEALDRQTHVPESYRTLKAINDGAATSMEQVSLWPKLKNATEDAEKDAAKHGQVYAGKHALEPPLGRMPKRARISVLDLQAASKVAPKRHGRRHVARVEASSIAFY